SNKVVHVAFKKITVSLNIFLPQIDFLIISNGVEEMKNDN
ncbi:MAG: hypothetical protein LiPW39_386, partial [Parcubacteria group bacterium LiPW_39]